MRFPFESFPISSRSWSYLCWIQWCSWWCQCCLINESRIKNAATWHFIWTCVGNADKATHLASSLHMQGNGLFLTTRRNAITGKAANGAYQASLTILIIKTLLRYPYSSTKFWLFRVMFFFSFTPLQPASGGIYLGKRFYSSNPATYERKVRK